MCGRYNVSTEEEVIEMREIINEINQRYLDETERAKMKTGEICPTDIVPVLGRSREGAGVAAGLMTWGTPRWNGAGVNINSRVETVMAALDASKPTAFQSRRCIVPSTGFYEWRHVEGAKKKEKYLLRLPGQAMLYMAGTWENCVDKAGNHYLGFLILTTQAAGPIAEIHDRMPVILQADEREAWLADRAAAEEIMRRQGPDLELKLVG